MSETPPTAPAAEDARLERRQRRRRRRRKAGLWSLISMAALAAVSAVLILSYLGTPITVPDWLRARITERINRDTGDFNVELGQMTVVIEEGWKPRLALRDVVLRGPDGAPLANLSELGGRVAMRPLLSGQLRPASIRVSGVQLRLRRDVSGMVDVAIDGAGQIAGEQRETRGLGAVIGQIDDALQRPVLAALTRIEIDNLTLRYEDARAGRAWNVDGGSLALTRTGDDLGIRGDFSLLGKRAYASTVEVNYSSHIGDTAADFGVNIRDVPSGDIAGQSPALAWLGALDAPISGALRVAIAEDGTLGPLSATLQIGAGVLQPNAATKPIAFTSARSYFTYDPGTQSMRFESVSVSSEWGAARAEGTAYLVGADENGWPRELQAQMRVADITADPADLYPEPIHIEAATLDLRLVLDPFRLSLGQLSLSDRGRQLILSGELKGTPEGWDLALDGRMDGLARDRLLELWPPAASGNTRDWIARNVHRAVLSNVQLAVRSPPKHRADVFLGFDFTNLTTGFMRDMPPIEDASGHATLYDNRFVIRADNGRVTAAQGGPIDISGTSFIVPDVTIKMAPAVVNLETDSTITAALALLDEKPFGFLTKQGRPVTLADGTARISGRLDLPLKKKLENDEVRFKVAGTLQDVSSTELIPGRTLSADRLAVQADNDLLEVGGDGRLGQVPFTGQWASPLGPENGGGSRLTGTIELSQRFADEFGIGLPPGSLSGQGTGAITVDLERGGTGDFALTSDLAGLGMRLQQLDWALAQGSRGRLEVRGRLGTPPQIDLLQIEAPGLDARGSVALRAGGTLERALFSRVKVGGWLDAPVELIGRGQGVTPAVRVTGGTVDLRQTSLTQGQGSAGQGGPVSLKLDRLQISDGMALTGFSAELDTAKGTDGRFAGQVNGGTAITGRIIPQGGRSAFRIQSQNAGGVLGAAGLLKQARGGTLDLVLRPAEAPGTYDGQLDASNVWLVDAPAMAALLSSLSVVGLLEQMSGNGILFNDVDARFRLSPDRLTLLSSSAVGASMGITMDGYYFMNQKRMDMQGVISPIYMVNQVGGIFTRRGEGLVGVNYKLKGPAASPQVSVNPLSIFTPGMFREIFRRPPPTVTRQRSAEPQAAPVPEQERAPPPRKNAPGLPERRQR